MTECDIAIIGGGIIGVATAMALAERGDWSVVILEAEDRLAAHQSGRNSGVIHAGLYYPPGSDKAILCAQGRILLYDFCRTHGIAYEQCGKLVLATSRDELVRLDAIEQRGRANGLEGLRRLDYDEIREIEPNAFGPGALFIPQTGIVDFAEVTCVMARLAAERGVQITTGARVTRIAEARDSIVIVTSAGSVRCRMLVACAGLHADRIARMAGLDPACAIIPFRGEFYELLESRRDLVRNLIYPVPDPALPFLGVHFTRTIRGAIELGPNAVLALSRNGYRRSSVNARDAAEAIAFRGFWRMAFQHGRSGFDELRRSWSKRLFARDARRLLPRLAESDLRFGRSGLRAQAVDRQGNLMKDFHFVENDRMIHVLNAPSPAATASIAIGRRIAERVEARIRCDAPRGRSATGQGADWHGSPAVSTPPR